MQGLFNYSPEEEILRLIMKYVAFSRLKGDYIEFGVYRGDSFISAFHFARMNFLTNMKFYAFDSFQGLPEIKGIDIDSDDTQFYRGEFTCGLDQFKKILKRNNVDSKKVHIVQGWYHEVLNNATQLKIPLKHAAVVWIDCDLYESTMPVLDFISDYLQDGSILVFHDWFCFKASPNRGEQRALTEWLARSEELSVSEFHTFGWNGKSFIVHLK